VTRRYGDSYERVEKAKAIFRSGEKLSIREVGRRTGLSPSMAWKAKEEVQDEELTNGAAEEFEATWTPPPTDRVPNESGDFVMTLLDLQLLDAVMDRVRALEQRFGLLEEVVHDDRERLIGLRDLTQRHVNQEEWDRAVRGRNE
jgi:hypothetical protein